VTRRFGPRIAAGLVLGLLIATGYATPAGAVTPRPTNDRSQMTAVEPGGVVDARIIGGDSLIEITVRAGHEVVVSGYGGEPYLRVQPDGSVQVNHRSAAVSLNRSRESDPGTLSAPLPADADWQPFGSSGTASWHDHRIHAGDGTDLTAPLDWTIPITVDGAPGLISGRLERLPAPSPLPALLGALALAAAILVASRRRPMVASALALGLATLIAMVTGFVEWHSLPTTVGRNAGLFLLPVGAALAVGVGVFARRPAPRLVARLVSISLLAGWLAFRWSILTHSVLVSDLAPMVDRVGLGVVLGASLAAAGLTVGSAGGDDVQANHDRSPTTSSAA
jgi:hypothetical protein